MSNGMSYQQAKKDVFMNLRSKIELYSRKIFCYKQEEEEINQT